MASTSSGCGKRSKKPNLDSNCKKMKKKPKLSDVMCPICLDILMEPVTLPCNHELCKACFEETVQNVKLSCPLCQMRISNWMRKATKNNTLINKARWNEIKRLFPDKVNDRLTGAETTTVDEDEISFQLPKISSPGLIRKEYELQLQRHEMEMKEERERERKASEDYIEKLKKEEERILKTKEKCVHHDEKLAKELHKCLNNGTIHDETQDVERFLDQIDDGRCILYIEFVTNEEIKTFAKTRREKCCTCAKNWESVPGNEQKI
ncbi:E3 ubiquitin-protein ligase [Nymphon striatum]|nr:E3 ubiquitin-protein ligase [Nymphon striatum]